ncbi:acyl-CoA dehydrogenase family protein [Nostoc sp.]
MNKLRESGLLPLIVPKQYGGIGATWIDALKVTGEICEPLPYTLLWITN